MPEPPCDLVASRVTALNKIQHDKIGFRGNRKIGTAPAIPAKLAGICVCAAGSGGGEMTHQIAVIITAQGIPV